MKYVLLMVNYNLDIENSRTFQSLINCKDDLTEKVKIIIWDNAAKYGNKVKVKKKFKNNSFEYIYSEKNVSLSKIYNFIIKNKTTKYDYLILFDNDSSITKEYFLELYDITNKNKLIELVLPKVEYKNRIYFPQKTYPSKLRKTEFYSEEDFGVEFSKNVQTINSGMIISLEYIRKNSFEYNEEMNFYGTDTYFMNKYSENSCKYFLMKYKLSHSLSMGQKELIDKILWRYKDDLIAQLIFLKSYKGKEQIIFYLKLFRKALLKALEHKNISFLTSLIKGVK